MTETTTLVGEPEGEPPTPVWVQDRCHCCGHVTGGHWELPSRPDTTPARRPCGHWPPYTPNAPWWTRGGTWTSGFSGTLSISGDGNGNTVTSWTPS